MLHGDTYILEYCGECVYYKYPHKGNCNKLNKVNETTPACEYGIFAMTQASLIRNFEA